MVSARPEFGLLVAAANTIQFIQNDALLILSLSGALEALFSPSTTELKFRVSSLIAAYLEGSGSPRAPKANCKTLRQKILGGARQTGTPHR